MKKLAIAAAAVTLSIEGMAAGFALYEVSARGNGMNGAMVGGMGEKTDASTLYYNPANMCISTNAQVLVGASFLNPFADTAVDRQHLNKMNPGWFTAPHFFATIPLSDRFALGIGEFTEYGMGTEYKNNWILAEDSYKTTVEQFTMQAAISFKATERLRFAAGLRASYFLFSSYQRPNYQNLQRASALMHTMQLPYNYDLGGKLKGDDWALGGIGAMSYDITDDLHFGIVYRSPIRHKINGHYSASGHLPIGGYAPRAYSTHGSACANVELPQSLAVGINWDATDRLRLGYAMTWTQWSTLKDLHIRTPGTIDTVTGSYSKSRDIHFNWHDALRFAWAGEYDMTDDWTVRLGYCYDMDPSGKSGTTMIPGGHRHIIGTGLGWRVWDNLRIDFGYNLVFMQAESRHIKPQYDTQSYKFQTRNAMSHIVSLSASYSF